MSAVIMVQGTSSHAGKSVLTAALCRIFRQDGLRVAPFKAQNMSLNSYVTPDGGEIGRAQAIQADAARIAPTVDMNPILLKPEADHRSQVVVRGVPLRSAGAREYFEMRASLWPVVTESLDRLRAEHDMVVIEGAGSPAEINLRDHEIVNMRVARHADAPVLLVADIDRGGVFASIVGTITLLLPEERSLVRGIVINRFRGDVSLLTPGFESLREHTDVPVLGVLPFITDLDIPEEDSLGLVEDAAHAGDAILDIAVVRLPHIANFDDFDPLRRHPSVAVRFIDTAGEVGSPDLIVLPGTKTTVADLRWLRDRGLADAIVARRSDGAAVIGICGGFQMLGRRILDPQLVESGETDVAGLGLLPIDTVFVSTKATDRVDAVITADRGLLRGLEGTAIRGYEIHMGRTNVQANEAPLEITARSEVTVDDPDGALDADGWVFGSYLHGLFHDDRLRGGILRNLAAAKGRSLPDEGVIHDPDAAFDRLASVVREHLDMDAIYAMTGLDGRHRRGS